MRTFRNSPGAEIGEAFKDGPHWELPWKIFILKENDMNNLIKYLVNRLKEPSTYAGFAGVALALWPV
jgi:hypothetical protein